MDERDRATAGGEAEVRKDRGEEHAAAEARQDQKQEQEQEPTGEQERPPPARG